MLLTTVWLQMQKHGVGGHANGVASWFSPWNVNGSRIVQRGSHHWTFGHENQNAD